MFDHDPDRWLTPQQVQHQYEIPYPQRLSVQLLRYGRKRYPRKLGKAKRKTLSMRVTDDLHEYLTRLNLSHQE